MVEVHSEEQQNEESHSPKITRIIGELLKDSESVRCTNPAGEEVTIERRLLKGTNVEMIRHSRQEEGLYRGAKRYVVSPDGSYEGRLPTFMFTPLSAEVSTYPKIVRIPELQFEDVNLPELLATLHPETRGGQPSKITRAIRELVKGTAKKEHQKPL